MFLTVSAHLRAYLRSRDYSQIYNGYLLICAVLYPRSFARCACVICHIVGDLYPRVLKGRNRKQPFHSSKTNMKTKQNQRKQISRWCSIRTNDCALLFWFQRTMASGIWHSSVYALHNSQWERVFRRFHPYAMCSVQSKSTYSPDRIRSELYYCVSEIGQCVVDKCAKSTFSRTNSDRAPFCSQTTKHQRQLKTIIHLTNRRKLFRPGFAAKTSHSIQIVVFAPKTQLISVIRLPLIRSWNSHLVTIDAKPLITCH